MAELTLKDFAEKLSSLVATDENVAALTFPIDFQDVSAETLPKVNEYEGLLSKGQYEDAYNFRIDPKNKDLESLILDATKLNYLQTLMLTSYEFAKGEKSAETTSYDNSVSGLDAANVQDAIDSICEDIGINGGEGSISDKIENLENSHSNMSNSIDEINDTLITKLPFGFGIDENGNYGYIKEGADTVTPFSEIYKNQIIDALSNTNLDLTYDSTWEEIIIGLNTLFPEQLNLLTSFTSSDWSKSSNKGTVSISTSGVTLSIQSNGSAYANATSPEFDLTHFNKLVVTTSRDGNTTKGGLSATGGDGWKMTHDGGTMSLTSGTKDISALTGTARISCVVKPNYPSDLGGDTPVGETYKLSKFILSV